MSRTARIATAALAVFATASCSGDARSPVALDDAATPAISDAANGSDVEGFYFLPPLVEMPAYDGTFDPSAGPTVKICVLNGDACGAVIATYTRTGGTDGETVRLSNEDERFAVNWHTQDFELDPTLTYRIVVSLDGVELGFADVDVVASGSELKNVNTGEYVALKDGRTLVIAFRIEVGAGPTAQAPTATDDAYATDEDVALNVPDGAGDLLDNDVLGVPDATLSSFGGGDLGGAVTDNAADATVAVGADGSLTVNADGSFTYDPPTGFSGDFAFQYRIANASGTSDATVTITVVAAPVAPVANDDAPAANSAPGDAFHAFFETTLTVPDGAGDLLANDALGAPAAALASFGGGDLGGAVTDNAAGGTVAVGDGSLTVNADGSFSYTPPTGFTGLFTFGYRLTNPAGSDDATVTIAVGARPAATNDTYPHTVVGHVPINTASSTSFSVLTNDAGDGVSLALNASPNGDVTLNPDGTFTFHSAAGHEGAASFTYDLTNGFGTVTGTVSLTVGEPVWFVDADAGAGGDGRHGSPFNCLSGAGCFAAAAHDADDVIFLYEAAASYAGPLSLLAGQRLIGQDATSTLASLGGFTPPADSPALPTMNSGNAALANVMGGVTLGTNNRLHGLRLGNTAGTALAGSAFGTLTAGDVNVNNGQGQALDLSNGTLAAAFTALVSTNSATSGVELVSVGGVLSTPATTVTSSTQTAVFVSGGAPTVSLGALTIDNSSTNATGLHVTSTGTVNTTGGSINTGTAGAVAADNAALGIALTSVRSVNGSAPGVQLVSTTGSFTVNGDGSNTSVGGNGSGGTVSGKSGADGSSNGNGVYLQNASNVTLRRMQLNDHQNHAVYAQNVTNFALDYSTVNGANGTSAAADEGSVKFVDLFGSGSITGSVVSGGLEDNVRLVNSSGTLDRLTVDNTTIGLNSTSLGNDGILFESTGTATAKLTVNNSRFLGARGDLLQVNVLATSVADLVISGGTSFANAHTNTPGAGGGVTVSFGGAGSAPTLTYLIQGNTFRDANGFGLNLFKGSGGGTMSGSVIGNTFGVSGTLNSGSANSSTINVQSQGTGTHTTAIQNNTLYQYNEAGIALIANDGSSTLNATVTGNTTSNAGNFGFAGLYVIAGAAGGDSNTLCLDASGNDFTAGDPFDFSDISLEQYQSTTVRLPGYAGGQFDTGAVATYLQGRNTGTPAVFVNTNNTGGGFQAGSCATP